MTRRIGHEIRAIQQLLKREMELYKLSSGNELTYIQSRIIGYVSKNHDQDIFQKDIEKELNIRRSTATQMLQILERDGYIERKSINRDARLKKIILTEKAIKVHGQSNQHINTVEKLLRKDISKEELDTFFSVIDQIKKNLE